MARKKSKRPVPEHIKAAADRAESRSKGKPVRKAKVPIDPPAKPARKRKATTKPEPETTPTHTPIIFKANKGGRPSKYRDEFVAIARVMCKYGATDDELAQEFGVTTQTIYNWCSRHPEFFEAVHGQKEIADKRVERSFYQRCVGYTYTAHKIMQHHGVPVIVEYTEHVPPDPSAALNWLANRDPERWRNKQTHEHTGKDGGAIEIEDAGDTDRARRLALIMAKAAKTGAEVTH